MYIYPTYILMAALFIAAMLLHLGPALLAGLLTYQIIILFESILEKHIKSKIAKIIGALIVTVTITATLSLGTIATVSWLKSNNGLSGVYIEMANIIKDSQKFIPSDYQEIVQQYTDYEKLKDTSSTLLHTHASELSAKGKEVLKTVLHMIIGIVIGALAAFHEKTTTAPLRLASHLKLQIKSFSDSFRKVVFAQIKISGINTIVTALYLLVILPIFNIHLPMAKTLVALTFLFGLIPVLGNLVTNSIIFIVSLSHSLPLAGISLGYLIVVHKLEYFLNAKIIGSQIQASAVEILTMMLIMEGLFGITGLIFAPILYAYIKTELTRLEHI